MAGLSLKHICKIYPNGFQAVRDFNLEIEEPEFVVLTGPAGCGKTTLLKVIAGLEEATSGKVLVDGQDVTDADPRDRQLAMLFKNSTLYPGMTVYENMAFALRMARMPQSEIDERVTEASELLGLSGILSAMPETLSEMDERRVLLGRAIVRRPKVLLMDSVLSGISVKPLVKFQKLYEKLGIIIVYVTSDPAEAMALGTRVVAMESGCVRQAGTPKELYENPNCSYVASFFGTHAPNLFIVTPEAENGRARIRFQDGELLLPEAISRRLFDGGYIGNSVAMGIRPEHICPAGEAADLSENGVFDCKLQDIEMSSDGVFWKFGTEENGFEVKAGEAAAEIGDTLRLAVDVDRIILFDRETKRAI